MESQANRNKVLERLNYDPKTQTIDTGIKKKNGEPIRIKLEISSKDIRGDKVAEASFETIDFEKAKEKLGRAPTLNEYIYVSKVVVQRSTLNKLNSKPFNTIYHEIGHLLFHLNKHYPNEIDKSSINNIKKIMNHVDKFDDEIKSTTLNNHDSNPEEYVADTYATNRTSKSANRINKEDMYKHELQTLYGQHKKYKKLLELAKRRNIANSDKTTKLWRDVIETTENDIARLKYILQQIHLQGDEGKISKEEMEKAATEVEKHIETNTKVLEASKNFFKKDPSDMTGTFDQEFVDTVERMQKESRNAMRLRTDIPNSFKESCLIMDNDEFFMEVSKNPDIKARKRTVKNLRKLGVDRAHEVDNKREIDELRRRMDDLHKKYDNKEISFGEALDQELLLKEKIRSLERGVDINIKDSYGNKHKVKLTSDKNIPDAYNTIHNTINIDPNTMNSNKFDSSFNHEAGHAEQNKRFGLYDLDAQNYNLSNTDDYPIKCAKLFLQKNKDKMNSHDAQWTELHADFLSCKKSGFGKMIKDVYSFKKSKKQVEDAMDACIKNNEAFCKKLDDRYLKLKDEDGNERTLTQKDIDECVSSYNQAKEKLDQYHTTLSGRYNELLNKMFDGRLSNAYKAKLEKLLNKLEHRRIEISDKMLTLEDDFKHNGIPAKNALNYDFAMKKQIREYNDNLKDLKAAFTTYDYRIKFMEDMYWIHKGHPGRCSMKYPPMTPADKKYMQEFTVEEMYLSKIITESEYIQLQERIQILTERSE